MSRRSLAGPMPHLLGITSVFNFLFFRHHLTIAQYKGIRSEVFLWLGSEVSEWFNVCVLLQNITFCNRWLPSSPRTHSFTNINNYFFLPSPSPSSLLLTLQIEFEGFGGRKVVLCGDYMHVFHIFFQCVKHVFYIDGLPPHHLN